MREKTKGNEWLSVCDMMIRISMMLARVQQLTTLRRDIKEDNNNNNNNNKIPGGK
jgi:hypothetical protein